MSSRQRGSATTRSVVQTRKKPSTKLPEILIASVPNGKPGDVSFVTCWAIQYRRFAPTIAPIEMYSMVCTGITSVQQGWPPTCNRTLVRRFSLLFVFCCAAFCGDRETRDYTAVPGIRRANAVLWRDPGAVERRDLRFGV